jgi:hypothetical protein
VNPYDIAKRIRHLSVDHARFRDLQARLFAHAIFAAPGEVIFVAGPTRVGKTTLKSALAHELVGAVGTPPHTIPLIEVEAATTQQGRFSTKHFTLRMLEELRDPVFVGLGIAVRQSQAETELRIQLERDVRYRGTKYVLLDEAHHFLRSPAGMSAGDILDWIKCIGNRTGVVFVLFGGYDLLRFSFASAHLNGRSITLDFGRYKDAGADLDEFDRILLTFDELVGTGRQLTLHGARDLLYEGTLGCFGLVSSWVVAALADMVASGSSRLSERNFTRTRLEQQIAPIREEIEMGERILATRRYRTSSDDDAGISRPTKATSKPFTRKPARDPVPHGRTP